MHAGMIGNCNSLKFRYLSLEAHLGSVFHQLITFLKTLYIFCTVMQMPPCNSCRENDKSLLVSDEIILDFQLVDILHYLGTGDVVILISDKNEISRKT